MTFIYIIDNGGIPFVVKLSHTQGPGVAHIFREKKDVDLEVLEKMDLRDPSTHKIWLQPWRVWKYTHAFIGKDPRERKQYGGHSLLLKTRGQKYISIGCDIFSFKLLDGDEIVDYVSIMGNSAVPYPYVVGKKNTYLMLEKTYLPNEVLVDPKIKDKDPYRVFYNMEHKKQDKHKRKHSLPSFKMLHERLDW